MTTKTDDRRAPMSVGPVPDTPWLSRRGAHGANAVGRVGTDARSILRVQVLGRPEARLDGRPLSFRTRRALALLIYLAVEGGLHARETLAALLSPHLDPERARTMLRHSLAALRQALGENPADPGAGYLVITPAALGLHPSAALGLDVQTLQAALTPPHLAPAGPGLAAVDRRAQLAAAVALARGPFLDGFALPETPAFEEWVDAQRALWQRRVDLAFDQLSELLLAEGDVAGAREAAQRWVALDALTEAAQQRLMAVYLAGGEPAAARAVYESYRVALAHADPEAMPAPELEALAARARGAEPAPAARAAAGAPLGSPLVGRAREFGALVAAYHRARRGCPQVVRLEGSAGLGKTRLASEFATWAAAQGADVLRGQAFEADGHLPYQPLTEALRTRLERENAPEDLLTDVWLAELSRLLPELRERYPDLLLPVGDAAEGQAHLFEAVARLGVALAARAPLVVVLDDAHCMDVAARHLLRYALRRWAESGAPILVLLALRLEDLAARASLASWLAGLEREQEVTHLALAPLMAEDTMRLVASLASAAVTAGAVAQQAVARLSAQLFARTGGHPFFLLETLKVLFDRQTLSTEDGRRMRDGAAAPDDAQTLQSILPPSVQARIRALLAPLSPAAGALLLATAVLGPQSTFERQCAVADLSEEEALAALEEVLARSLLRETGGPAITPTYTFSYDLIREAVSTQAGHARRRLFQRRALALLERAGTPAADLVDQALGLGAGLRADGLLYNLATGDDALRQCAARDALAHAQSA